MSDTRVKIFVVDNQMKFIDSVNDFLIDSPQMHIDLIGKAVTRDEFMNARESFRKVDLFVLSSTLPDGAGMELYNFLQENRTLAEKPVIFTVDKQTRGQISVAQEAGVDHVFQKPFSAGDFCKRILYHGLIYKGVIEGVKYSIFEDDPLSYVEDAPESKTSQPQDPRKERKEERKGSPKVSDPPIHSRMEQPQIETAPTMSDKLFAFFSPKSTGKTTLISNIAQSLIRSKNNQGEYLSVCILDFNFQYPTMTQLFDQEELEFPRQTIYDVFLDTAYMDEELIENALVEHRDSGIKILYTPNNVDHLPRVDMITKDEIEKVLLQVREMFDFVLIDTHNDIFSTVNSTLLEYSDRNYIVLEPDYTTVIGGNKILQVIQYLEDDRKRKINDDTYLILNKDTGKLRNSLNDETVYKFMFGKRFITRIPYDPDFNSYVNRAEFAFLSGSPTRSAIQDVADHINPFSIDSGPGHSRFNIDQIKSLFKRRK